MIVFVFIVDKELSSDIKNGVFVELVCKVGEFVVKCVKDKGVFNIVFDCSGYLYYGCIVVLVEVVCEVGFEF